MVENCDGPPTGYNWKQFLAKVKLFNFTRLDKRLSGRAEMLLFSKFNSSSALHFANDLGIADNLLYLRPRRFKLDRFLLYLGGLAVHCAASQGWLSVCSFQSPLEGVQVDCELHPG